MFFIPDEIDTAMFLRKAWEDTQTVFFCTAAYIVGVPCVERAVAFASDDVSVEHYVNIWVAGYFGKSGSQLGPRLRGDDGREVGKCRTGVAALILSLNKAYASSPHLWGRCRVATEGEYGLVLGL